MMILLCGALLPQAAIAAGVERGAAVTDPLALRELELQEHRIPKGDRVGFGLGRMLDPANPNTELRDDRLFALLSMALVRPALDAEFDRYIARHTSQSPGETIGVGPSFDVQLFDREPLYSGRTRFVLSGIVNRMDRSYLDAASCGEIRLLYRLVAEANAAPTRLPMSLNMVLKAKGPASTPDCAEIARRWLVAGESQLSGAALADQLSAPGGPLEMVTPDKIDRIETNLQIAHAPKSPKREFETDYLFKVFRYNAQSHVFEPAPMENQIDRDNLSANAELGRDFKRWLLDPQQLGDLDRGTILVPDKYLATGAIAATPAGLERDRSPIFSDDDIVAALQTAADRGIVLQNTRSPAGFARRLGDIGCSGCHQTRGIGGFHFPGADWIMPASTATSGVPGSPHFVGDQPRRRDILAALRGGKAPDFSRGFSDRPQLRGSNELAGTANDDGWGATCYRPGATDDNDPSFASWTCAEGLSCQPVKPGTASRFGMCFVANR
jgi:hypothetical protein